MAIGDTVDLGAYDPRRYAVLRAGMTLEGAAEHPFDADLMWGKAVFAPPTLTGTQGGEGRKGGLLGFLKRGGGDGTPSGRGGKRSLKDVLSTWHAAMIVDAGEGPEAMGVPFRDVALLCGQDPAMASVMEQKLAGLMLRQFRDMYGEDRAPRVRYFLGRDHDARTLSAFFGYGVFFPDTPGERTVGRIRVRACRDGEPEPDGSPPSLPDGAPAGFYKGQTGLAFSADEAHAPATHPALPPDLVAFVGRLPGDEQARTSSLALQLFPMSAEAAGRGYYTQRGEVARGFEECFEVFEGRSRVFVVDIALDARTYRLQARHPGGPALKILGIAPTVGLGGRDVYRWWADVREHGELVGTAMHRRGRSLLVRGRSLRVYDWVKCAFMPSGRTAGAAIERIEVAGKRHVALVSDSDEIPLGYLACGTARRQVTMADRGDGGDTGPMSLDAVGASVSIEWGDLSKTDLTAAFDDLPLAVIEPDGDLLALQAASPGHLFVEREDSGRSRFVEVRDTLLRPGERAAIGPVIVTFERRTG